MLKFKRRRSMIRFFSFIATAFVVAVGLAVAGFVTAYNMRMNIEYTYQRALIELNDHVNNIQLSLQKGMYASTSAQLVGLSAQIWSDSGAAKADLAQLSLSNVQMQNTTKFISQVGDYANSLSKNLMQDQKVTDQDRATIKELLSYSTKLSDQLSDMTASVQTGRMSLFKTENVLNASANQKQAEPTIADGFGSVEKSMAGLPSMIYDGPFSDNVLKKMPTMTQGKAAVSTDNARGTAAQFLQVAGSTLKNSGQTAGNLPTYNFTAGTKSIYVAKNGGYIVRLIDSRDVGRSTLDNNAALQKAKQFLSSRGIGSMTETYTLAQNNICMINFAYVQNGVTCYPDLIKVGVALDNGEIVSFDATGYLMNHKKRDFPAMKVSEQSLVKILNPLLKVSKVSYALIPTGGGGEVLCYEFKCVNDSGQNIIDYFNVTNGVEEQLLILISTPGGTLAL